MELENGFCEIIFFFGFIPARISIVGRTRAGMESGGFVGGVGESWSGEGERERDWEREKKKNHADEKTNSWHTHIIHHSTAAAAKTSQFNRKMQTQLSSFPPFVFFSYANKPTLTHALYIITLLSFFFTVMQVLHFDYDIHSSTPLPGRNL